MIGNASQRPGGEFRPDDLAEGFFQIRFNMRTTVWSEATHKLASSCET